MLALVSHPTRHAFAQSVDPVRVVLAVPLTGSRQSMGHATRTRAELVAAGINARGGVIGRPLLLDVRDDACSREGARDLATMLTAETSPRASVVIGHPCPATAITAAPLYAAAGRLFLAAGVRHPELTDKSAGKLVLRAAGRDDHQGHDAGARLRAMAGNGGQVLIIHDRTAMAREIADAAKAAATVDTAPPVQILTIVAGERDYQATADAVRAANAHAVLFAGFPAEAAILISQLRTAGITAPVLLNDAMATDEFIAHAGGSLDQSIEIMMPVSINRDIVDESESADELIASDAAAALLLWRDAVVATASLEPGRISEHLTSSREHLEEIAFNHAGDAKTVSYAPFRRDAGVWRRVTTSNARVTEQQGSRER